MIGAFALYSALGLSVVNLARELLIMIRGPGGI